MPRRHIHNKHFACLSQIAKSLLASGKSTPRASAELVVRELGPKTPSLINWRADQDPIKFLSQLHEEARYKNSPASLLVQCVGTFIFARSKLNLSYYRHIFAHKETRHVAPVQTKVAQMRDLHEALFSMPEMTEVPVEQQFKFMQPVLVNEQLKVSSVFSKASVFGNTPMSIANCHRPEIIASEFRKVLPVADTPRQSLQLIRLVTHVCRALPSCSNRSMKSRANRLAEATNKLEFWSNYHQTNEPKEFWELVDAKVHKYNEDALSKAEVRMLVDIPSQYDTKKRDALLDGPSASAAAQLAAPVAEQARATGLEILRLERESTKPKKSKKKSTKAKGKKTLKQPKELWSDPSDTDPVEAEAPSKKTKPKPRKKAADKKPAKQRAPRRGPSQALEDSQLPSRSSAGSKRERQSDDVQDAPSKRSSAHYNLRNSQQ